MSGMMWTGTVTLRMWHRRDSSAVNPKGCEITLVTLLRCIFEYLNTRVGSELHLNSTERCVIYRLRIWIPYCSGGLGFEESMLRMLLHHDICSGMVLVALSPETTLSDLHRDQISHDVKYMWVLTENSSSESEQSVFGTDNQPFSSGGSEQIWTVWYETFVGGVAGRRTEILYWLIDKISWVVKVNLCFK